MTNAGIKHIQPRIKTSTGFWLGSAHINLKWIVGSLDKFKFAFVRYPLSWYRSYFCFRKYDHPPQDRTTITDVLFRPDFEEYIENCLAQYPEGFVSKIYRSFLGDHTELVDFVGKQENLADDLVKALNMAGVDFDEEKLRATPRVNTSYAHHDNKEECQLNPELEQKILEAEKWAINTFYD